MESLTGQTCCRQVKFVCCVEGVKDSPERGAGVGGGGALGGFMLPAKRVWSEARLSRNSSCKLFIFNQLHIVRLSLFREPFESLLPIALLVGFHPLIDVLLAVFDHQID